MKRSLLLIMLYNFYALAMESPSHEQTPLLSTTITQNSFEKLMSIISFENKTMEACSKQKAQAILETHFNAVEDSFEKSSSKQFQICLRAYKNIFLSYRDDKDFDAFRLAEKLFLEKLYEAKAKHYRTLYFKPRKMSVQKISHRAFVWCFCIGLAVSVVGISAIIACPSLQVNQIVFKLLLLGGPLLTVLGLQCVLLGYSCKGDFCQNQLTKQFTSPQACDYLKKLTYINDIYRYDSYHPIHDLENQAE